MFSSRFCFFFFPKENKANKAITKDGTTENGDDTTENGDQNTGGCTDESSIVNENDQQKLKEQQNGSMFGLLYAILNLHILH